jgi:hypothetical protein
MAPRDYQDWLKQSGTSRRQVASGNDDKGATHE